MGYPVRFDIRLIVNPESKICEDLFSIGHNVLPEPVRDVDSFAVSINGAKINGIDGTGTFGLARYFLYCTVSWAFHNGLKICTGPVGQCNRRS